MDEGNFESLFIDNNKKITGGTICNIGQYCILVSDP